MLGMCSSGLGVPVTHSPLFHQVSGRRCAGGSPLLALPAAGLRGRPCPAQGVGAEHGQLAAGRRKHPENEVVFDGRPRRAGSGKRCLFYPLSQELKNRWHLKITRRPLGTDRTDLTLSCGPPSLCDSTLPSVFRRPLTAFLSGFPQFGCCQTEWLNFIKFQSISISIDSGGHRKERRGCLPGRSVLTASACRSAGMEKEILLRYF